MTNEIIKKAPGSGKKQGLNQRSEDNKNLLCNKMLQQDQQQTNNLLLIFDTLIKEAISASVTFASNESEIRYFDHLIRTLKLVERMIKTSPLLDWQIIRAKMKDLFEKDNSLNGFYITYIYKHSQVNRFGDIEHFSHGKKQ